MLMIGPNARPILATTAHMKMSQTRSLALYISSILPATTTAGIAERKPAKKRPIATPAREGDIPEMRQKMLYSPVLTM